MGKNVVRDSRGTDLKPNIRDDQVSVTHFTKQPRALLDELC